MASILKTLNLVLPFIYSHYGHFRQSTAISRQKREAYQIHTDGSNTSDIIIERTFTLTPQSNQLLQLDEH